MFKGIDELARRLADSQADNIAKLLMGFNPADLKILLNALRKLPGLKDFVQPDSTIILKRWRDIIQLRDPSSMESIKNITMALAPMQLKVRKMLGWLVNKSESENIYGPACGIFSQNVADWQRRVDIYLDDRKRRKDSKLGEIRGRRAADD